MYIEAAIFKALSPYGVVLWTFNLPYGRSICPTGVQMPSAFNLCFARSRGFVFFVDFVVRLSWWFGCVQALHQSLWANTRFAPTVFKFFRGFRGKKMSCFFFVFLVFFVVKKCRAFVSFVSFVSFVVKNVVFFVSFVVQSSWWFGYRLPLTLNP